MEPVSIYRICAPGAVGPAYSFGGEVPDGDFPHAVWLGWLPLAFPDFDAPGLALAGDAWLTAPPPASVGGRGPAVAGLVTAGDAAGELAARGACGLTAFTGSPEDVPDAESLPSSLALSVADDLEALVRRVRGSHDAVADAGDDVDAELAALDGCQAGRPGDSPVRRRYGLALRDFRGDRLRLHRLLDAVVRIGVFDPAASPPEGPPAQAGGPAGIPEVDPADPAPPARGRS